MTAPTPRVARAHIEHARPDKAGTAWCGAVVGSTEAPFLNVDHAALAAQRQAPVQACERCVNAVVMALRFGQ